MPSVVSVLLFAFLWIPRPALAQDTAALDQDTSDTGSDLPSDTDENVYPTGGQTVTCSHGGPTGPLGLALGGLLLVGLRRRRRVRRSVVTAAGLTVAALAVAPAAHAQALPLTTDPGLDVNRFEPSGLSSGFSTTYSGRQLNALKVSFEAIFSYGWRPFQVSRSPRADGTLIRDSDTRGGIEHLGAMHLRLGFAPTDWVQFAVSAPALQILDTRPGLEVYNGGIAGQNVGVGDVTMEFAFTPLRDDVGGFGLQLVPFFTAPTGSRNEFLTDGLALGGRMALSGAIDIVHIAAFGGYRFKLGNEQLGRYYAIDDEVMYGAGLGFEIRPQELRLNVEINGATTVGPGRTVVEPAPLVAEQLYTALEATGGLAYFDPTGFAFTAGLGAGITPAPGTPRLRAYLGFGYVPVVAGDPDGDGIRGRADGCPKEPEDLDGFEDEDGCPDLDNDADGVPDDTDACPLDPEDIDGVADDDGCPEGDADGDGVADGLDKCPTVPEDRDGFEDLDGCPDVDDDGDGFLDEEDDCPLDPEDFNGIEDDDGCPEGNLDRDGDGVKDPSDVCPDVPEDRDGWEDTDGCPDPDNDRDGVPDAIDACPDQPEDMDGWQDDDGCPDFDADGDGIPDQVDACPTEPETRNGVDDNDGCPDEALAVRTADAIEIRETIRFVTAKATIQPESYPILDAVVAILQGYPDIELVQIEGHTDAQGSDSYNLDLSQRRALSVRQYLVDAGVSPTRLLARGFGETYPIAPNSTAEGRALNRRVAFRILEDGPPQP